MESPASSPLSCPLTHYVNHHKVPPLPCPAGGTACFNKGPILWPVCSGYFLFLTTYLPTSFDSLAAAFGLYTKPTFAEWQLPNLHLLNDNYQTCICWMTIQQGSLTSTTSDIFPSESSRSVHCTCRLSLIPFAIATESQVLPNPKLSSWADCSGINCCPASTHFHPSLLLLSELSVKSRNFLSACMFLLIIK